jgi:hypothetical protein
LVLKSRTDLMGIPPDIDTIIRPSRTFLSDLKSWMETI